MRFKPVTEKYKFDPNVLTREYPEFIREAITDWLRSVALVAGALRTLNDFHPDFVKELNLTLRRKFSDNFHVFTFSLFVEPDLATNVLALFLQNYATKSDVEELERVLAKAGSAYAAIITSQSETTEGVGDLVERVPTIVAESAKESLNAEPLLLEAWTACYSRNPDYEKTVSKCCDVLEGTWGKKYFPNDPKPQVKKFVHDLRANASRLAYAGVTIVNPKNTLTDLAEMFSNIRGQHTSGQGRIPTKEEAVFVLHYTVFVWNLENQ